MTKQIDLSKELTPAFFTNKDFKVGKVLIFADGTNLKITRLNRKKKVCIAEEIKLYTEDEINAMPREEAEEIIRNG